MELHHLPLPPYFRAYYRQFSILTPIQQKSIEGGLLGGTSQLVCAPTASGKTLVATMAIAKTLELGGKAIYLVPLKALAGEKYKEYLALFKDTKYKVVVSTSDIDSDSSYLVRYDVLIMTTEKLDALLRHKISWLGEIKAIIIDEIHLLNDPQRGPTLEVVLTLLKTMIKTQLIGLSATIGNPKELAQWLGATLVMDSWRPVELKQGICVEGRTKFY